MSGWAARVIPSLFVCGMALAAERSGVWLDVPFVKQQKNGCGAASIAMVMRYWQAPATRARGGSQCGRDSACALLPAGARDLCFRPGALPPATWIPDVCSKGRVDRPAASFGEGTSIDRCAEIGPQRPSLCGPHRIGLAGGHRAEARSRRAPTAQTTPFGLRKRVDSGRQLDPAGSAGRRPRMVLALVFTILLPGVSLASVAEASPQIDGTQSIQQLFEEKRWEQVVEEARTITAPGAETRYYYGVALAQLGRWDEARTVFLAGQRLQPDDARFPVELGGVAFKQKRFAESARWLRRGMRLNPADSYAADFLASIYFLQGNLEAALKYWNRIAKPHIENMRVEPGLRVDSVLLDRAFTFAPGGTLLLSDLLTTRARVRGLGIFPASNFRLDAQARRDIRCHLHCPGAQRLWGKQAGSTGLNLPRHRLPDRLSGVLQPGAVGDQHRFPGALGRAEAPAGRCRIRAAAAGSATPVPGRPGSAR